MEEVIAVLFDLVFPVLGLCLIVLHGVFVRLPAYVKLK
jgi:hypothetical protein